MENTPKSKRIEYIDALKGFAIFCVLWGHSLQYLKKEYDFFHNPIYEFIYSFHMPLFFMISGFFFYSSLKLNFKDFLYKKSVQLLLPCVTWMVINYLMRFAAAIVSGNEHFLSNWMSELKPVFSPGSWPWFLRELFVGYFVVYVSLKLLKKNWLACPVSLGIVFMIPFLEIQKFLLPMFWAGIYLKENYSVVLKYAKQILIVSGVAFAVCLLFWDGNYTMYKTTFPKLLEIPALSFDFTNIDVAAFYLFIGLCGSLFWFVLFGKIFKNNKFFDYLSKIGVNTLAIYLLQRLILENFINRTVDLAGMNEWVYNLIVTPLVSLAVLIVCMLIIKVVQKNRYMEFILFGKEVK